MARNLTNSEIKLLTPVYQNTLRYPWIECDVNVMNVGGKSNSITPGGKAYFSTQIYCDDFSKANPWDQWVFVHEMMHVWQWGHGVYPVYAAIGIFLQTPDDYAKAYPYDLTPGKSLKAFNIEQQASIVADYWALLTGTLAPQNNNNAKPAKSDYGAFMADLWKAGPSVRKLDQTPF
jgi:hypothetical protein